jgi:hypothetical protein
MAYREKINYRPNIFCSASNMAPLGGSSINTNDLRKMSRGMPISSYDASTSTTASYQPNTNISSSIVQQSLGTAFGEAQSFATTSVLFERGGVICTMVIGYDEKRGLKARGIAMPRKHRVIETAPQAFPAMAGCPIPPGWQG